MVRVVKRQLERQCVELLSPELMEFELKHGRYWRILEHMFQHPINNHIEPYAP